MPITWRDEIVLVAPAVCVLVLVSSQTGINHHLRYVLPALPFLFVWISRVGKRFSGEPGNYRRQAGTQSAGYGGPRRRDVVVVAMVAAGVASSLSVYPHSLSYFNELVGGPRQGHLHLASSNIDWGQDLWYLQSWYNSHPQARPLGLGYDVKQIDPRLAGIEYEPVPRGPVMNRPGFPVTRNWPWRHKAPADRGLDPNHSRTGAGPRPGWFVLSVNQIHLRTGELEYFLDFDIADRIGYSLIAYHLTPEDVDRLRRKLSLPEP